MQNGGAKRDQATNGSGLEWIRIRMELAQQCLALDVALNVAFGGKAAHCQLNWSGSSSSAQIKSSKLRASELLTLSTNSELKLAAVTGERCGLHKRKR